jgi:hypothetical protein
LTSDAPEKTQRTVGGGEEDKAAGGDKAGKATRGEERQEENKDYTAVRGGKADEVAVEEEGISSGKAVG